MNRGPTIRIMTAWQPLAVAVSGSPTGRVSRHPSSPGHTLSPATRAIHPGKFLPLRPEPARTAFQKEPLAHPDPVPDRDAAHLPGPQLERLAGWTERPA